MPVARTKSSRPVLKSNTTSGSTIKDSNIRQSEDGSEGEIDFQYNPDVLQTLVDELHNQMEMKCALIQKDVDFMATSLKQAFHLELIKLPSQIKNMSLKKFKNEFGDSLDAVTYGHNLLSQSQSKLNSSSSKNNNNNKIFETPSSNQRLGSIFSDSVAQTPGTNVRQPREGEIVLSENGSPLGAYQTTVIKPENTNKNNIAPPTPSVVKLTTGDVVDLENMDIDSLSKESKADALQQMQAMMTSMQAMILKLAGKKE